ncbi:hypothetical protein H6G81_02920 [Scytonema hofmannii FACHB-248]|uniref:Uncharacterized protein n=1 Tax=Scytonema hofmannii FACHB-248 TaxID=1842502 RepID=A0ABR8GL96_9CYAN|nr:MULTISPECIES: hypothetical protein [Nostocales]MBD2603508.1 hypothetical protein [Scytonema hofmannii FACHB-248]
MVNLNNQRLSTNNQQPTTNNPPVNYKKTRTSRGVRSLARTQDEAISHYLAA